MRVVSKLKNTSLLFLIFLGGCSSTLPDRKVATDSFNAANSPSLVEWTSYSSDLAATKFSYANKINKSNVKNLKMVWKWSSTDNPIIKQKGLRTSYNETTPLMVNGKVYVSTILNQVSAIDPHTGKTLWNYDPRVYESYRAINSAPVNQGFVQRGLTYKNIDGNPHLYLSTNDGRVIALDADTGLPIKSFGNNGEIDLRSMLNRGKANKFNHGNTSPAIVCQDTLIVGSSVLDVPIKKNGRPPGDVLGFDIRSGELKWTFRTIPKPGEFGNETWENDSWKYTGNTNVWTTMSADEKLGSVFLPVSTPSNDFYGGERHGDGLFGESIVSLKCATGERNWHFQLVHHGLWDYDPPTAPILFDLQTETGIRKIVVQVTKQAFAFTFDRETGKPIWPIEERPVPMSDVPGEKTSPTQPFPTLPLPYDRQGATVDNLIDYTPELRAEAIKILSQNRYGALYTPPSREGTIGLPGLVGGASWAGAAYSPITKKLYVPSITKPAKHKLINTPFDIGGYKYIKNSLARGTDGPQGLPLFKPPYGRITAIDMASGHHSWMTPIGSGPKDHKALKHLNIKNDLGWARRIFVLATPDLLFAAQEGISKIVGFSNRANAPFYRIKNDEAFLRALDPETGEVLAKVPMPVNAFGSPMTYVIDSKQYIVMPYGGANLESGLVAFSLE